MLSFSKSPYTRNAARLADLIAAIQVLGTYRFASRHLSKWEKRLGRTPVSADNWLSIFSEHPEFFTIQGENVALVWRRSKERDYDTYEHRQLPREEAIALADGDPEANAVRLSRPPLDIAEISKLVDLAVSLHEREINHQQERRWWFAAVIAVIGLFVGWISHR